MKIGLVCPYNIARGGGVQECVKALRTELTRRGHQVKILTPRPRDLSKTDTRGVIFLGNAADFHSPLATTAQVSASITPAAIDNILEREAFDVLHFHEPWVPFLSYQVLMRSNSVNVATFHAKVPENMMGRTITRVVMPYTKSALKYLDGLTSVSDAAADYVRKLTKKPVEIVSNGIDLNRFHQTRTTQAKQSEQLTIVYIGRLERRKGVRYLLDALQLLQKDHDNLALTIIGDGPQRLRLEEAVRNLGLRNVTFTGYITERRKVNLLRSADLFCSPAVFGESFGIVLLEAMGCGVPVVCGDNAGYKTVMQGLGSISIVNPHDPGEFARRMDLLLHEKQLRALWRRWAKQTVKQYSYQVITDEYEKAYARAIEQRSSPKQLRMRRIIEDSGSSAS
jgi:phosphatidylinositol alpha-mannosyltransferase